MATTVLGLAADNHIYQVAMKLLDKHQFPQSQRSIILPHKGEDKSSTVEKLTTEVSPRSVEGGYSGAGVGSVIGAIIGMTTLMIPGVGLMAAAGPLLGIIGGALVGAAAGSVAGTFVGLGISQPEADHYLENLRKGSILLVIHVDDPERENLACEVLTEAGLTDVTVGKEATEAEQQDIS